MMAAPLYSKMDMMSLFLQLGGGLVETDEDDGSMMWAERGDGFFLLSRGIYGGLSAGLIVFDLLASSLHITHIFLPERI